MEDKRSSKQPLRERKGTFGENRDKRANKYTEGEK